MKDLMSVLLAVWSMYGLSRLKGQALLQLAHVCLPWCLLDVTWHHHMDPPSAYCTPETIKYRRWWRPVNELCTPRFYTIYSARKICAIPFRLRWRGLKRRDRGRGRLEDCSRMKRKRQKRWGEERKGDWELEWYTLLGAICTGVCFGDHDYTLRASPAQISFSIAGLLVLEERHVQVRSGSETT